MAMQSDVSTSVLPGVKHVVLVMSGKGGVGKSTLAAQLVFCLKQAGKKVGLLDIDLCGPSIPHMLCLEGKEVHQCSEGWVPIFLDQDQTVAVMSIGFLLNNRDDAVVWRGPKKNAMVKQFITDVAWQDRDFLIIDTPPGTSDEHITVVETLRSIKPEGAILVTTPQAVAVGDVRREVTFCKKAGIPILGIVENMSGFVCPTCSECTYVFSKGGGEQLAIASKVPFLGCIPLDPELAACSDNGKSFLDGLAKSLATQALNDVAQTLLALDKDQ